MFTPGGYTAVSINCDEKEDGQEWEPADLFGRKYFYAGSYTIKGNEVIQLPENASEVDHIGVPGVRLMKLSKDLLTLEGTNGSKFKAIWKKIN